MILNIFKNSSKDIIKKLWTDIDDYEEKRQFLQHLIVYIACNENIFLSSGPYETNDNYVILNIGSGYCFWSRDFISKNKKNNYLIINIDINEFYKDYEISMIFEKIDLKNDDLKFIDNSIGFIYQRDMISVYKDYEWDNIIKEVYRVLRKNKYFEIIEYDVDVYHDIKSERYISDIFFEHLTSTFKNNGYIYDVNHIYAKIKNIFINSEINHLVIKLPLYDEETFNNLCTENAILGFNHIKNELNIILKIKYNTNFEQALERLKKEWIQNKSYMKLHIIYGKK